MAVWDNKIVLLAVGGSLGALARYGVMMLADADRQIESLLE